MIPDLLVINKTCHQKQNKIKCTLIYGHEYICLKITSLILMTIVNSSSKKVSTMPTRYIFECSFIKAFAYIKCMQMKKKTELSLISFIRACKSVILPGYVHALNTLHFNDEVMTLSDVFERLRGYKYILHIDIDEYLVPTKNENLPTLFVSFFFVFFRNNCLQN